MKKQPQTPQTPQIGWTTKVDIEDVHDGDTIKVSITRKFSIRLVHENDDKLIFQAPELKTPEGELSKEYLINLLLEYRDEHLYRDNIWKNLTAFFPTNKPEALMDINSFNRLLATVWADDKLVTQEMLDAGHAKMVKR